MGQSNRAWYPGAMRVPGRVFPLEIQLHCRGFASFFVSCLLVLPSGLLFPVSVTGDTLDRLFFSPKDRAHLEQLRGTSSGSLTSGKNQQDVPKVTENKPQFFALKGTVTKKSGFQALWLNDLNYTRTDLPPYVKLHQPFLAGQVLLRVPETGKSYAIRPGQTLDINSGRIRESYEQAPKASVPDAQASAPTPLTPSPSGPGQIPGGAAAPKP